MYDNKTFQFDFKDLEINASQIENVLGYQEGDDRDTCYRLIEEILKEAEEIMQYKSSIHHFR